MHTAGFSYKGGVSSISFQKADYLSSEAIQHSVFKLCAKESHQKNMCSDI